MQCQPTERATTNRTILPLLVAVTGELWYCEQSLHNINILLREVNGESTGTLSEQDSLFIRRQDNENFIYYRICNSNGFWGDFAEKRLEKIRGH